MVLTTTYTIVPFAQDREGKLSSGAPRRSTTRSDALAAADQLSPFYAGVIVLKEQSDGVIGALLDPLLICVIGDVPGEVITRLAV